MGTVIELFSEKYLLRLKARHRLLYTLYEEKKEAAVQHRLGLLIRFYNGEDLPQDEVKRNQDMESEVISLFEDYTQVGKEITQLEAKLHGHVYLQKPVV